MCYYITVVTSSFVAKLFPSRCRGCESFQYSNSFLTRQYFNEDRALFCVYSGFCACDLFSEESSEETERATLRNNYKKYKKKNWSQSKIDRAIQSKRYSRENRPRIQVVPGYAIDVRTFIANFVDANGSVDLFTHFYSGSVESDRIELSRGPAISSEQFLANDYPALADLILTVRNGSMN